MRISYNNFIDDATSASIVASSEDSSYPVENVQDQRLTTQWYSDANSSQTVIVDLGATTSCSIFAIMAHNLVSGGTVVVNGNDVITEVSSVMTWITSDQSSTQTITYNDDMMVKFVTPISNRYWQFSFASQTSALQIGRLWIGDYIDISPSSLDDFTVTKKRDDIVVYGKNRQKYASIGNGWREIQLTFPRTSPTSMSSIYTFYDTVGKHSSFIFANFDTLRGYELVEPMYCSIADDIGFSHARNQFYTYSLTLTEDR